MHRLFYAGISRLLCLFVLLPLHPVAASLLPEQLIYAAHLSQRCCHTLPVSYDFFLNGGYFAMPSARMGQEGQIAFGYSSLPPYSNWNLRLQLNSRIEISGSYRIFRGIEDPILSPYGFGDMSDKGVNIKLGLLCAEESHFCLPSLAIGWQDFMGTRRFEAYYIVATQLLPDLNLELTLGFGAKRFKGFFGAALWMPFLQTETPLAPLSIALEWDATDYTNPDREPHPEGRRQRTHCNGGVKYRLWNAIDFTAAYMRGNCWAFGISGFYNFGSSRGILPKIDDPLPRRYPILTEPFEQNSPTAVSAQLLFALNEQGFDLHKALLTPGKTDSFSLRLHIVNRRWRALSSVKERLVSLLASLCLANIDEVVVVEECDGLPMQQMRFSYSLLNAVKENAITAEQASSLLSLYEVSQPIEGCYTTLFEKRLPLWRWSLAPRTYTFFGSSRGKFKYTLGISAEIDGFLSKDYYYDLLIGYTMFSDLGNGRSVDRLNPSQLINVRTDIIRYLQRPGFKVERAYLQRNWNLGGSWFARASLGLFEIEYGGIAAELLYYPLRGCWALGWEGAVLRKRTLKGVGFSDKVRLLHGFCPSWHRFTGSQGFFTLYYDWRAWNIDLRARIGKFLANDKGVRLELSRYFSSGMRITFFTTFTNGADRINDQTYYDKGIAICMPLDLFYTYTCKKRWRYSLSAWLRDVGVIGASGNPLYDQLYDSRH